MKKAQAATEAIISYMKSILIAAIVLAALFSTGILDAGKILPRKCSNTAGFDCFGEAVVRAADNSVEFAVYNNFGQEIILNSATVGGLPVLLGDGGDCSTINQAVGDPDGPGPALAGDILMSYGEPPPTPSLYDQPETISDNELIRIKIICPQTLQLGQKFKDTITIYYQNKLTGLIHPATVSIATKVM